MGPETGPGVLRPARPRGPERPACGSPGGDGAAGVGGCARARGGRPGPPPPRPGTRWGFGSGEWGAVWKEGARAAVLPPVPPAPRIAPWASVRTGVTRAPAVLLRAGPVRQLRSLGGPRPTPIFPPWTLVLGSKSGVSVPPRELQPSRVFRGRNGWFAPSAHGPPGTCGRPRFPAAHSLLPAALL